jgi:hypothetical protein
MPGLLGRTRTPPRVHGLRLCQAAARGRYGCRPERGLSGPRGCDGDALRRSPTGAAILGKPPPYSGGAGASGSSREAFRGWGGGRSRGPEVARRQTRAHGSNLLQNLLLFGLSRFSPL